MMIEESLAYSNEDFLGDLGGYTGIFIGGSILTIYDMMLLLIEKGKLYTAKLKEKLRNHLF